MRLNKLNKRLPIYFCQSKAAYAFHVYLSNKGGCDPTRSGRGKRIVVMMMIFQCKIRLISGMSAMNYRNNSNATIIILK